MEARSSQAEMSANEQFFKYFQRQITEIQDQMSRLDNKALIGGERKDAGDHCLASITRLSAETKDASGSLPAYDVKTYSEAIKALQDKLAETQASFVPKQKFSFKTKKNASAISIQDAAELAAQARNRRIGLSSGDASTESSFSTTPIHLMTPPNERQAGHTISQPKSEITTELQTGSKDQKDPETNLSSTPTSNRASGMITMSNQTSSHIIIPASSTRAQAPCQLHKIAHCCIDLSISTSDTAPFASLTINQVQSSLVFCGLVSGPAHITGVKNSVLLVSCRQFRMHECENVDIYLHCTSRPIIEDCKNVRFAKLPDFYYNLLHPTQADTEDTKQPPENQWDQIDDFKWLRNEPSPNWSILPPADHIEESVWRQITPGKPGKSVNEILALVGGVLLGS